MCVVTGGCSSGRRGLCEQQGFGVDHELCQGLVAVDYRARCPSALNKRMSRIKRQCSPMCCKLGFTPHIRDRRGAEEPRANMMDKKVLILQLEQGTFMTSENLQQRVMIMVQLLLQS